MLLNKVMLICLDRYTQSLVGRQDAFVEGILMWMPQSHELVVVLKVRERQLGHPAHRLSRCVASPFELLDKRSEFPLCWNFIKPAHPHVYRMDFSASKKSDNGIARLLHLETTFDDIRIILCHAHHIGIAEKVWRVQHIDM